MDIRTDLILNAIGVERLSVRIEFKMIADVPDDYFDLNELPEIAKELKAEMIKFAVNLQYLFETLAEAKDFAQLCRENLSNVHNKEVWVSEVLSEEE